MNIKLKLLRDILIGLIEKIDNGTCNPSEEELEKAINIAEGFNKGVKRISKAQACDNILHCSASTFNNYLSLGIIPAGRKEKGFKELFWAESDFAQALEYSRKHK